MPNDRIPLFGFAFFAAFLLGIGCAAADKIKHSIAVFSGLDKITGRVISFEVAMDETVQFGSLEITDRVCYTRPPTEAPQTDTFVEVDEVGADNKAKRIFTGWMFAASPGLHALDHPVYDIWLTGCKGTEQLIATPPTTAAAQPGPSEISPQEATKPAEAKPKKPAGAQARGAPPGAPVEVGPPPGFVPQGGEAGPPTQQFAPPPPDDTGGF